MTQFIIKGAIYTNGDLLLQAHFTGDCLMVDCTQFKTRKEIKQKYDAKNAKKFLDNYPLTYNGVKYYECEYGPYNCENFTLLSDLSSLEHTNEETEF